MKLIRFAPIFLLPIHFFLYLVGSNLGLMLFNFDAILLSFYFGIPFWWVIVYPLFALSRNGKSWSTYSSILIAAALSIFGYVAWSLQIPTGVTVVLGAKVYVDAGVSTISYINSLIGQAFFSALGVLIGTPIFICFLKSLGEKDCEN